MKKIIYKICIVSLACLIGLLVFVLGKEILHKNEEEVIAETVDMTPPIIVLEGDKFMSLPFGETYEEPGFSAKDDCDGDITDEVTVYGEVRVNGTSELEYKVTDASGNTCVEKRYITVELEEDQKVIYLTFDDGPGPYTEELLDVLDRYQVKVTFFVTGGNDAYYDLIGEAYKRGHTIALHSYSHQYSIYKETETFYEDLQKIEDLVVAQTGQMPFLYRFPGGTSNTVSKKYNAGIMTELIKTLPTRGYTHCDWNVSSGDGGGAKDEATVIQNVLNGIRKLGEKESAIVLMHDIRSFSVDAVDDIIEWGMEQGYIFLPLVDSSPIVQQKAAN